MLNYIDIVKIIACLLIVNFHTLYIYPESLQFLSFGGDLGNNTFFLVSGFLLYDKTRKTPWNTAHKWLIKRYVRILPIVLLLEMLTVLVLKTNIGCFGEFIRVFIFPSQYWFTGALLLFYPLFFVVVRTLDFRGWLAIAAVLLIFHAVFDSLYAERYIMGFLALLAGAEFRETTGGKLDSKLSPGKAWLLLIGTLLAYAVLKFVYAKRELMPLHILIGILTIGFALFLLISISKYEARISAHLNKHKRLGQIVRHLSQMTLFFYIGQQFINKILVQKFLLLPFGARIVLYWLLTLAGAVVLYLIDLGIHGRKRRLNTSR